MSPVRAGSNSPPGSIPCCLQGEQGTTAWVSSFSYFLNLSPLNSQNLCRCECIYTCVYTKGWGRGEREEINTWFIYLDLYKGREIKSV